MVEENIPTWGDKRTNKVQRFYKSKYHKYLEQGTYLFVAVGAFIMWGWALWRSVN